MQVRTLRAHGNEFGGKYQKAAGAEYEITDDRTAKRLITRGLVEEVKNGDGQSGGASGSGSRAKPVAKSDGASNS